MSTTTTTKRVLLIDRQATWRERSAMVLREAGFNVQSVENYELPQAIERAARAAPDLIIIGCANVGSEERRLISRLLAQGMHLVVLATVLPWAVMRGLFRDGADDVADKPYDPEQVLVIVRRVLQRIDPRTRP